MATGEFTNEAEAGRGRERGAFLITIDTEGDNLWSKPREITVRNAEALPRFQGLCERYDLRPTYLVNWEMAQSPQFVEFGRDVSSRGRAEIGMHLHAWNSPPLVSLTGDDFRHQPYLIEYPEDLISEKVKVMTNTLEESFGTKMVSHRAGRWGLDATYARILSEAGYAVDCSVTPHVDWTPHIGAPDGTGGPDFRAFPESAYFMDLDDISIAGTSSLLQVPMTILPRHSGTWARRVRAQAGRVRFMGRVVSRLLPATSWLRPNGRNGDELIRVVHDARDQRRDYVEFMLHSSELMAAGSPTFPTDGDIEGLYDDLEALFDASTKDWTGLTLSGFRAAFGDPPVASTQRASA